jgi:hypothetical protein
MIGALVMFIILKYFSTKGVSGSGTSAAFKTLVRTQQFANLVRTNEFRELVKTREFTGLVKTLAEDQLITLSKTLAG